MPTSPPVKRDIDELRAAVLGLSNQITTLSAALTAVNDLQESQITKTAHIEANAVTKEEAEKQAHQVRKQVATRLAWALLIVVLVLGSFIGGLFKYQHDQRSALYKVCVARNDQNTKVYSVLRPDPTRPMTPEQAKALAILKDAFKPLNCEGVK